MYCFVTEVMISGKIFVGCREHWRCTRSNLSWSWVTDHLTSHSLHLCVKADGDCFIRTVVLGERCAVTWQNYSYYRQWIPNSAHSNYQLMASWLLEWKMEDRFPLVQSKMTLSSVCSISNLPLDNAQEARIAWSSITKSAPVLTKVFPLDNIPG